MCLLSRKTNDNIRCKNTWVPKSSLVNKVGHKSYWVLK